MIDRRTLIAILLIGFLVVPLVGEAQQQKIVKVGFLNPNSVAQDTWREPFRKALRDLGWIEGENLVIEWRYADGSPERLTELAADLVRLNVAVLVAPGNAAMAAQRATSTVPIVATYVSGPWLSELVSNFARPGANLTAISTFAYELAPKRLELLKQAHQRASRVAVLGVRGLRRPATSALNEGPELVSGRDKMIEAAKVLGVRVSFVEVKDASDYAAAFKTITDQRVDALFLDPDPVNFEQRGQICQFALAKRLSTITHLPAYLNAGCLISYGQNNFEMLRRTVVYVDKILKGTKPGDLPIEMPTKFELVINLKTAEVLGLTIPPLLLLRADRVIE